MGEKSVKDLEESDFNNFRWKPFVGIEVCFTYSAGEIYGKMQQPNLAQSYVDFLPHRVYSPGKNQYYLEKNIPRRISLFILDQDTRVDFLPFHEGHLEDSIEKLNQSLKKDDKKIGFN